MRQAAKRRRRSCRNRPSRTSVSRSRVVEATRRNGSVTAGFRAGEPDFAVAQDPRETALRRRRELVDVLEEQRAGARGHDRGVAPIDSRSRASVRLDNAPNSRASMSAGPAVPQSIATNGDARARARVQRFRDGLRTAPGFGDHQHRRAASRGKLERAARRHRAVRGAEQRQRNRGRAASGFGSHDGNLAQGTVDTASPCELQAVGVDSGRRCREGTRGWGRATEIVTASWSVCQ